MEGVSSGTSSVTKLLSEKAKSFSEKDSINPDAVPVNNEKDVLQCFKRVVNLKKQVGFGEIKKHI